MSDPFAAIRGRVSQSQAREAEFKSSFQDFEARLKEATAGYAIRGNSESCTLGDVGPDDYVYGYLFFDEVLNVAYRSTEDDLMDMARNEHGDQTYSVRHVSESNVDWLLSLSAPTIIESLLQSITKKLDKSISATSEGSRYLAQTANMPLRDLEAGLVDVAQKLSFSAVIEQWQEAQSALGVDPPDAVTRACRLVETLCKHILDAKGIALPNDKSIQPLYKAASRSLQLSTENQISVDLRGIAAGMLNTVANIGALRTHGGTAHGTGPNGQPVSFYQARLAVNAAGVAATFLMEALLAQMPVNQTSKSA